MARPKKQVDETLLEKLSKLHLSDEVLADCFDISPDTLNRRFADKIKVWRSKSKAKIAEVLFEEALNKRQSWAVQMIARRHLNYDNDKDTNTPSNFVFNLSYSKTKLDEAADRATKKK